MQMNMRTVSELRKERDREPRAPISLSLLRETKKTEVFFPTTECSAHPPRMEPNGIVRGRIIVARFDGSSQPSASVSVAQDRRQRIWEEASLGR
jgi:hypothetical protein